MKNFVIFLTGAAVGSAAAWYFAKKKYEAIAKEEIEEVKAVYSQRHQNEDNTEDGEKDSESEVSTRDLAAMAKDKPSITQYAALLKREGYVDYTKPNPEPETFEERSKKKPRVISPEQFGDRDDFTIVNLTYYDDQILTDENDKVIHNVEDVIGFDSLSTFGDYEDDAVHVIDERLKIYYEILKDPRKYSEVLREEPYKAEV